MISKIRRKKQKKNSVPNNSEVLFGWHVPETAQSIGFHSRPKVGRSRRLRPLKLRHDGHGCVIAATGGGKSRNCVIPALLTSPNAAVCIDVKGELYHVTHRHRAQLGPVIVIDPFGLVTSNSDGLNSLDAFRFDPSETFDKSMMMVELIRGGVPPGLKDPFWERTSGYVLSGLITCIAEHEEAAKRTLNTLFSKYFGSEDFDYTLAVELDTNKKIKPLAYSAIASYLSLPDRETRPSVKATCVSNIACLASEAVEKTIGKTTFDLHAFRRGDPMTIYIVIPPGKLLSHAGLLRLLLGTLMNIIATRTSIPEQKTCFHVDEAAQLGFMPQLLEALTLLRSYGLQCTTYWQDLSQMQHHYPTAWQAILNNSEVLQVFGLKNLFAARGLAEVVGVDARQLVQMADDEQLLVHNGKHVHFIKRLDYLKDTIFKGRWDPNPMFVRSNSLWSSSANTKKPPVPLTLPVPQQPPSTPSAPAANAPAEPGPRSLNKSPDNG